MANMNKGKVTRKYYNFSELLSRNGIINFVVGARGYGKTYGAKKWAIKDWLNNRKEFIYLRRYEHELKNIGSFFNDIASEFPDEEFRINGRQAQIVDGMTDKGKPQWVTFGYFIALSTSQQVKSVPFPDVNKILFDEFILDTGFVRYMNNEVQSFLDFIVTVDRFRDEPVRTVCMANSTSINNPYFSWWDIRPPVDGSWWRGENGAVVAHFPDSTEYRENMELTGLGALIAGSRYADYSLGNVFYDNTNFLIGPKEPKSNHYFDIDCGGVFLQIWRAPWPQDSSWYFETSKKKSEGVIVLAMSADLVEPGKPMVVMNKQPMSTLRTAYRQGTVRFRDTQSRSLFIKIANI